MLLRVVGLFVGLLRAQELNYDPMLNELDGSLKSCTLDSLSVVCTCDKADVEPPKPRQGTITYITIITNDAGMGTLSTHVTDFIYTMAQAQRRHGYSIRYKLVHKMKAHALVIAKGPVPIVGHDTVPCDENKLGYIVTEVPQNVVNDLKSNSKSSFHQFFHYHVPDTTTVCAGNAYKSMYADLDAEIAAGNAEHGEGLQFTLQPFADGNRRRMVAEKLYRFNGMSWDTFISKCNSVSYFADSALIITDGHYHGDVWVESLSTGKGKQLARTELFKCAIAEAHDAPQRYDSLEPGTGLCDNYNKRNQHEYYLTKVDRRRECPLIPRFGNQVSRTLVTDVANEFIKTIADFQEPQIYSRNPSTDYLSPLAPMNTIPKEQICYYDIIVALDLDCVDYNENPVIVTFAIQLVNDILDTFENRVSEGAVRLGIVGFHSELEIAMNLFEMSSIDGRAQARDSARKAIKDLQFFSLSRRNYKTSSFRETFRKLSSLFDARQHKKRELIIVSNASPGQYTKGDWDGTELDILEYIKRNRFDDINILPIPVNQKCKFDSRRVFHEDCSYMTALSKIDSYRLFAYGGSPALCPTMPCKPGMEREWRDTFYAGLLDQMARDLEETGYSEYCTAKPPEPQPCGCATRGRLNCCIEPGKCGPPGQPGSQGADGPPGPAGLPGPRGLTGPAGFRGEPGMPGLQGKKGLPAPEAPKSRRGQPGNPGESGINGEAGNNGPPGPTGVRGPPGRPGSSGDVGNQGRSGTRGIPGLAGEEGPCGPPGPTGVTGRPGEDAYKRDLVHNKNAIKADMYRRMKKFAASTGNRNVMNVLGERFVGIGNNGRSFCECKSCEPIKPVKEPPSTCMNCLASSNMVLIADRSKSVTTDPALLTSLNNVFLPVAQQWFSANSHSNSNALFATFSNRLQVNAKMSTNRRQRDVKYYDYASYRMDGRPPSRRDGAPEIISIDEAKQRLHTELTRTNEFGEPVLVQENKWGWVGDEVNLGPRRNRQENEEGTGSTFFYSMLGDLSQFVRDNKFNGPDSNNRATLYIMTDAVYFHDDVHEWKISDQVQCEKVQGSDIQPFRYDYELDASDVCKIVHDLQAQFETIFFIPANRDVFERLKCKMNDLFMANLREYCPHLNIGHNFFQFTTEDNSNPDKFVENINKSSLSETLCCPSNRIRVDVGGQTHNLMKAGRGVSACEVYGENRQEFISANRRVRLYKSDERWVLTTSPVVYYETSTEVQSCCPQDLDGNFLETSNFRLQCLP